MKSIAIMQPYFLPYIGYFQTFSAVDKFIILDDVNYITRGWINRNRLLLNGEAHTYTVPINGASRNKLICDLQINQDQDWQQKLKNTVRHAYGREQNYPDIASLFEDLINYPSVQLNEFLLNSLTEIVRLMGLDVEIERSSSIYKNAHLKGQNRILDICKQEQADEYVNAIGGKDLYDPATFEASGINLKFLRTRPISYAQNAQEFVPALSILDVLMYNKLSEIQNLLEEYDFE